MDERIAILLVSMVLDLALPPFPGWADLFAWARRLMGMGKSDPANRRQPAFLLLMIILVPVAVWLLLCSALFLMRAYLPLHLWSPITIILGILLFRPCLSIRQIGRREAGPAAESLVRCAATPLLWYVVGGVPMAYFARLAAEAGRTWADQPSPNPASKAIVWLAWLVTIIPDELAGLFTCWMALAIGRGQAAWQAMICARQKKTASWTARALEGAEPTLGRRLRSLTIGTALLTAAFSMLLLAWF